MGELGYLFNVGTCSAQSVEDCLEVCSVLHRDDSKLVFFVDPDEEGLFLVVEDASAVGPVSVEATGFKISVSLLEEEVVIY